MPPTSSKELHAYTWDELIDTPEGTTLHDFTAANGTRFLLLRSHASVCAYLGVPMPHPLRWIAPHRDDMPIEVHGGFTFAAKGDGHRWPKGWYWWGWDYAHHGDANCFPRTQQEIMAVVHAKVMAHMRETWPDMVDRDDTDRRWLPLDVWADSQDAIIAFSQAAAAATWTAAAIATWKRIRDDPRAAWTAFSRRVRRVSRRAALAEDFAKLKLKMRTPAAK